MNLDFLLKFGVMVHEFLWFIACPTHLIWHDLTKLINIWFCTALHIDIGVYDSYLQLLLPSHQDWLDGEAGYFTTEIMQIGMGNRIDFSASEGFKEQSSCLCQYMGHIGPHTHIHASYIYNTYVHTHIYIYVHIMCMRGNHFMIWLCHFVCLKPSSANSNGWISSFFSWNGQIPSLGYIPCLDTPSQ